MSGQQTNKLSDKIPVVVLLSYLVICLVFGGASRYWLYAHGVLQSGAAVGIAVLTVTWSGQTKLKPIGIPVGLLVCAALIGLFQSIPIPFWFWVDLPGRAPIVDGYDALNVVVSELPASLDVEATISSTGYVLVPLFVLLLSARIGIRQLQFLFPPFLFFLALPIALLGLSQVLSGKDSFLYLYDNTNFGAPVGTFANVNHFALFLLMTVPFAVMLVVKATSQSKLGDLRIAQVLLLVCTLLIVVVGIIASGSLAVYLMSVPVGALTLLAVRQNGYRTKLVRNIGLLMGLVSFFAAILVLSSPLLSGLGSIGPSEDPTSRLRMWSYTTEAIKNYWPVGSGMGTYQTVIPLFEDPTEVTSRYIALAHNEYLQILMELGLLGLVLMLAALSWLFVRLKGIWFGREVGRIEVLRKLASIGILICLAHSIVDYPLRTPAISSVIGVMVALIALPKNRGGPKLRSNLKTNEKRIVL